MSEDTKGQTLHDSSSTSYRVFRFIETENRRVVTTGLGKENYCLMGMKFHLGIMESSGLWLVMFHSSVNTLSSTQLVNW